MVHYVRRRQIILRKTSRILRFGVLSNQHHLNDHRVPFQQIPNGYYVNSFPYLSFTSYFLRADSSLVSPRRKDDGKIQKNDFDVLLAQFFDKYHFVIVQLVHFH